MNTTKTKNGNGNGKAIAPPTVQVEELPVALPGEVVAGVATPVAEKPPVDTVASALLAENEKLKAELAKAVEANKGLGQALNRANFKLQSLGSTVLAIVNQP
jgi:hypothetical protein